MVVLINYLFQVFRFTPVIGFINVFGDASFFIAQFFLALN